MRNNNRNFVRRNTKDAVNKVFDDLDSFREFCVQFGYVFREEELYRSGTYEVPTTWDVYMDFKRNKRIVNNWSKDRHYE